MGLQTRTVEIVNLVVDTSVWSFILSRPRVEEDDPYVHAFLWHRKSCIGIFHAGNIIQELLDGLSSTKQFDRLLALLVPSPLLDLDRRTTSPLPVYRPHAA